MSGGVNNRCRIPATSLETRRVLLPVSSRADHESAASGPVDRDHLQVVDPAAYTRVVDELDQTLDVKAAVTRVLDQLERERARTGDVDLVSIVGHAGRPYRRLDLLGRPGFAGASV
jgi:hypothetical protein